MEKQYKTSKFGQCLGSGTPEVVLPKKTPSPPLRIGCFIYKNHIPQASVQGLAKERTGELCPFASPTCQSQVPGPLLSTHPRWSTCGQPPSQRCRRSRGVPAFPSHFQAACLHQHVALAFPQVQHERAVLRQPERGLLLRASSPNIEGRGWAGQWPVCFSPEPMCGL